MTRPGIERLNAALSDRYVIEREIGEGGMATVYLAEDLKHHRKVALKVLKPELAAVVGAERFLAEIEVTANLQHPNILPLFDSGEADSFLYYVMPFVDGETLRDRLDREHQLPVEEAVRLATEVAEALDHAHRQGIVHRDIKPGNLLLRDGRPLVADFGIALAVGAAGGARLTETGLSVGTPYYMSPEQATGDSAVGAPTDVYALGCVLYEMLVGEPPYPGATAQAVLGKIIAGDFVPPRSQRPTIPANVDAAIRKSLEKLPADRFADAGDLARALGAPGFRHGEDPAGSAATRPGPWRTATGVLGAITLVLLGVLWTRPAPAPDGVTRYRLDVPIEVGYANTFGNHVAISPDGRMVAFTGADRESQEAPGLWIRDMDNLEPRRIAGTERAFHPTFSPDGTQLAFVGEDRAIKVVSLSGRPPLELTRDTTVNRAGISWGDDGYLYYSRRATPYGISRIPSGGGASEVVTTVDDARGEVRHYFPDVLPGSELMVLTIARESTYNASTRDVGIARIGTGEVTVLFQAVQAHWSTSGHLLAVLADGSLVAVPLDTRTLEIGPQIPVLRGVALDRLVSVDLAVSRNGVLVYQPGDAQEQEPTMPVWVSPGGQTTPVDPDWRGNLLGPRISPDARFVAYYDTDRGSAETFIEVKELDAGARQRLTPDRPGVASDRPVWTRDGQRVIYMRIAEGRRTAMIRRADAATEEAVFLPDVDVQQLEIAPGGRWLVYRAGEDIFIRSMDEGAESRPLLADPEYYEGDFALSPDGRWIAYVSGETGAPIVYVRPFPSVEESRTVVSLEPAIGPRWAPDGSALYFRSLDGNRMLTAAVTIDGSGRLEVSGRGTAFDASTFAFADRHAPYDVHPDGRLLMIQGAETRQEGLIVVENFMREIEGRRGG